MLSPATVRALDELARRSRAAHPEGGLLYTFTEAAAQSHSRFARQLTGRGSAGRSDDGRELLAVVLGKALGHLGCIEPDGEALTLADDLMQRLRDDLTFTSVGSVADDGDDSCWGGATVHMARETDNRYFSLYLWGSID